MILHRYTPLNFNFIKWSTKRLKIFRHAKKLVCAYLSAFCCKDKKELKVKTNKFGLGFSSSVFWFNFLVLLLIFLFFHYLLPVVLFEADSFLSLLWLKLFLPFPSSSFAHFHPCLTTIKIVNENFSPPWLLWRRIAGKIKRKRKENLGDVKQGIKNCLCVNMRDFRSCSDSVAVEWGWRGKSNK